MGDGRSNSSFVPGARYRELRAPCESALPFREGGDVRRSLLCPIAQLGKQRTHAIQLVALDLQHVSVLRASGPALRFQLSKQGREIIPFGGQSADDRHGLPLFPFFHRQFGGLRRWRESPGRRRAAALRFEFAASIAAWRPVERCAFKEPHGGCSGSPAGERYSKREVSRQGAKAQRIKGGAEPRPH